MATWRRKTYDELPALSVRGADLRRSLRIVTAGWVLATLWIACCSGAHMNIFGRMLGFQDFHFGLVTAVAYMATLGQLAAAILIERTGLKKFQFIECMSIARGLWLTVAAIPFLVPSLPSDLAVYSMLGVLLLSNFLSALGAPAWITWMGDLIPKRIRGRYLGYRSLIGAAVRLPFVIAVGAALVVARDPGAPMTAAAQPVLLRTICVILALGAVFGTIDILLFHRIREVLPTTPGRAGPPAARRRPLRLREMLMEPLEDRVFRHYAFYGATITFAMGVGGAYFWRNAMESLGFSALGANVVFLVIGPIAAMATARGWGRLIDKWGRRPVLVFATFLTMFSVSGWFFVTKDTAGPAFLGQAANWLAGRIGALVGQPGWVWVTPETPMGAYLVACWCCALGSAAWCGVSMTQIGIMFGFADGKSRSKYVAACAVFIGLGGALGGLTGGVVTTLLQHFRYDRAPIIVGPFLWNNWHAVFLLSLLARFAALLWLINMPDPGSKPVRHIIRMARANVYNFVAPRLFYPLRIFGSGRAGRERTPPRRRPRRPGRRR